MVAIYAQLVKIVVRVREQARKEEEVPRPKMGH